MNWNKANRILEDVILILTIAITPTSILYMMGIDEICIRRE
nr:MAG TPA: hypothetical protein [Caudoviricetes sp.]